MRTLWIDYIRDLTQLKRDVADWMMYKKLFSLQNRETEIKNIKNRLRNM